MHTGRFRETIDREFRGAASHGIAEMDAMYARTRDTWAGSAPKPIDELIALTAASLVWYGSFAGGFVGYLARDRTRPETR